MKLIYLYIVKYRTLESVELNFDSNIRFKFESGKLGCKVSKVLEDGFFGVVKKKSKRGVVESISAIVGENGSGKTSVSSLLNRIFMKGREDLRFIYVLQSRSSERCEYYCFDNMQKRVDDDGVTDSIDGIWHHNWFENGEVSAPPMDVIYYSPYCHINPIFDADNTAFYDISTTGLINKLDGKSFAEFRQLEFDKILDFLQDIGRDDSFWLDFPIPIPGGIVISSSQDLVIIAQKTCINRAEKLTRSPVRYASRLPYKIGTLEDLPESDRVRILRDGPFAWDTKDGKSALLHFFCDALDIGLLPSIFLRFVAGYFANLLQRQDYAADVHARNARMIRLADIFFGVRNAILTAAGKSVSDEVKKSDLDAAWKAIDDAAQKGICRVLVNRLRCLKLSNKEWRMPSQIEMTQEWQDAFSAFSGALWGVLENANIKERDCDRVIVQLYDAELSRPFLKLLTEYKALLATDFTTGWRADYFKCELEGMSSGEMSYLTLFARLHRLINEGVDSRHGVVTLKKDILLFLDEAETALHPEWQRQFIAAVIRYVELRLPKYRVQIIIATHSPMLLSDIPIGNCMFLKKGKSGTIVVDISVDAARLGCENTFAANVFDLYYLPFFMDKGTIGRFASDKIRTFQKRRAKNRSDKGINLDKQFMAMIGDPFIREALKGC